MKMPQIISIIIVIILGMLLNNCGQMTAKDEGMASKSIGESSGTTGDTTTDDTTTDDTTTTDTTAPTVFSIYPTDNQSSVSITTDNISVTFSETMDNVTANTSDTSCSGSFQLSPDNFNSCVQMSSSPSSSDNKTFKFAPSLSLFYSTNYKIRITTAARDRAGNVIASQNTQTNGFNTTVSIPTTAGYAHSCFILDNGSVKCWGANASGQL
ncbi:MAG: Ig-like domain-containing protein, partial [Candidatus Poribacteria bacterium]|nr:Ig-like domain-containing protein [Candidatus Poribacteria bacterium]